MQISAAVYALAAEFSRAPARAGVSRHHAGAQDAQKGQLPTFAPVCRNHEPGGHLTAIEAGGLMKRHDWLRVRKSIMQMVGGLKKAG